jgi:prepilin-type N-terminal cleavage/methylation domain-containing protein
MKKQTGFTLIELMIVIAIIALLVAGLVGIINQPSRDDRCKELCEALRHRVVKATPDACVCEDPETKQRQAYPMQNGSYGAANRTPAQQMLWEADE